VLLVKQVSLILPALILGLISTDSHLKTVDVGFNLGDQTFILRFEFSVSGLEFADHLIVGLLLGCELLAVLCSVGQDNA